MLAIDIVRTMSHYTPQRSGTDDSSVDCSYSSSGPERELCLERLTGLHECSRQSSSWKQSSKCETLTFSYFLNIMTSLNTEDMLELPEDAIKAESPSSNRLFQC